MKATEKKLLKLFAGLPEGERATLLAFAEFLHARSESVPPAVPRPNEIPRPAEESVVGALKRLSATYPMLEKAKMLNETSVLMAQHVMQGREAGEVIEELELVFRRHYERLTAEDAER
jgi:hypothetical protein